MSNALSLHALQTEIARCESEIARLSVDLGVSIDRVNLLSQKRQEELVELGKERARDSEVFTALREQAASDIHQVEQQLTDLEEQIEKEEQALIDFNQQVPSLATKDDLEKLRKRISAYAITALYHRHTCGKVNLKDAHDSHRENPFHSDRKVVQTVYGGSPMKDHTKWARKLGINLDEMG